MTRQGWLVAICLGVVTLTEATCWWSIFRAMKSRQQAPSLRGDANTVLSSERGVVSDELSDAGSHEARGEPRLGPITSTSEPDELHDSELLSDDIRRQITLSCDAAGHEVISGIVREEVAVGQRSIISHVVFQPALKVAPCVEAFVVEGPPATIKATRIEAFGVRFEIRLEKPSATPSTVAYEFMGSQPVSQEQASQMRASQA
jgi:hypothetical protein